MECHHFIRYVIHSAPLYVTPWLSLYDTCMPCLLDYDVIVNTKNREGEAQKLAEKLDLKLPTPLFNTTDVKRESFYDKINQKDINTLIDK